MTLTPIKLGSLTIEEISKLFQNNKLIVNESYQRSDVWKLKQKQALIESILGSYPIGVLVLWKNNKNLAEIIDGQQRFKAIINFMTDGFEYDNSLFSKLSLNKRTKFRAYDVHCISLNQNLSKDEVSSIFIRLQEGTPLNTPGSTLADNSLRASFDSSLQPKAAAALNHEPEHQDLMGSVYGVNSQRRADVCGTARREIADVEHDGIALVDADAKPDRSARHVGLQRAGEGCEVGAVGRNRQVGHG